MEVCWGRVYTSFIPICASYFIALVTNSNSCWHWDHPRPFPEGSGHWTAELIKQGPRKYDIPGTVSTSQGRRALATSQPKAKARSGRKPKLSKKGAGMCYKKSPSIRRAFWGATEAETRPDTVWDIKSLSLLLLSFQWLASNFSGVLIFLLPSCLLSSSFLLSQRLWEMFQCEKASCCFSPLPC